MTPLKQVRKMDSITTMTAKQYRLREWAAQIRDCRNRPAGVSMEEWCSQQGITKANYYYRLRRVREACLEGSPEKAGSGEMVPVSGALMTACRGKEPTSDDGLELMLSEYTIRVTVGTDLSLLAAVLRVIRHVE